MITSQGNRSITDGQERSTRDRLLEAALGLFAQRGFDQVSVGDIEQAVGLVPRRGALYRHFPSKLALLNAATEEHLASVAGARVSLAEEAGTASLDAVDLAHWILAELDRQRHLTQILERDGERLHDLRDRFRREVSNPGYQALTEILRAWLSADAPDAEDADAEAVLLLGSLVNARRSTWTLGAPALDVDDDRIARAWSRLVDATRLLRRTT